MSRVRKAAGAVLVLALAGGLGGCSFVGDVAEGQRITTERLQVADALRVLTEKVAGLDEVVSARYHFDAVDVATTPGLEVEFASADADAWRDVVATVEAATADGALEAYPVAVSLAGGGIRSSFDTQWGAGWLDAASLATAARLAGLFAGARVEVSGVSDTAAFIAVTVPGSAEDLLVRVASDAELADLLATLDPHDLYVEFRAPGVSLSGGLVALDAVDWATQVLSTELPRIPVGLAPDEEAPFPSEWVQVDLSSGMTGVMLGVELFSGDEPGAGAAWDELVELLVAPLPQADGAECIPFQITYGWPGVQGNFPSFTNACVDYGSTSSDPDRASIVELHEALTASGIDLDALGFTLT